MLGAIRAAAARISSARCWRWRESAAVREALMTLSDGERAAIELAYFGGHTYKEVAVLLEQPEGTVKSRIRSGLLRLRAALIEAGVHE